MGERHQQTEPLRRRLRQGPLDREDTTLGSITRNVSGPDANLAATTSATGDVRLQVVSLHGDVAATIDPAMTTPEFNSYDEFGVPAAGQA